MSELLSKARESALLWSMAKFRFVLFSLVALGLAWQGATANLKIESLSRWELINVFIYMAIAWGNTIMAYLDKTANDISKGRLPIGDDIPGKETIVTTTTETAVKTAEETKGNV